MSRRLATAVVITALAAATGLPALAASNVGGSPTGQVRTGPVAGPAQPPSSVARAVAGAPTPQTVPDAQTELARRSYRPAREHLVHWSPLDPSKRPHAPLAHGPVIMATPEEQKQLNAAAASPPAPPLAQSQLVRARGHGAVAPTYQGGYSGTSYLTNGNFDAGAPSVGWTTTGTVNAVSDATGKEGGTYARATTGACLTQPVTAPGGESLTLSVFLRAASGSATSTAQLTFGPSGTPARTVATGPTWQSVLVPLTSTPAAANVRICATGGTLDIDGAVVQDDQLANASFEGPTGDWAARELAPQTTLTWKSDATAREGNGYLEFSNPQRGASVQQSVPVPVISSTPHAVTFGAWLRSPTGAPVTACVKLRATVGNYGGAPTRENATTSCVNLTGNKWVEAQTTYDATPYDEPPYYGTIPGYHVSDWNFRAEVYLETAKGTVDVDATRVIDAPGYNADFQAADCSGQQYYCGSPKPVGWQPVAAASTTTVTPSGGLGVAPGGTSYTMSTTTLGGSVGQTVPVPSGPLTPTVLMSTSSGTAQVCLRVTQQPSTMSTGSTCATVGAAWTRLTLPTVLSADNNAMLVEFVLMTTGVNVKVSGFDVTGGSDRVDPPTAYVSDATSSVVNVNSPLDGAYTGSTTPHVNVTVSGFTPGAQLSYDYNICYDGPRIRTFMGTAHCPSSVDGGDCRCYDSGTVGGDWDMPAGFLRWNRTYGLTTTITDSTNSTSSTYVDTTFTTNYGIVAGAHQGRDYAGPNIAGINIATGDAVLTAVDNQVRTAGPPLSLTRTYNSSNSAVGAFGGGWSSLLDMRLDTSKPGPVITYADGRVEGFTPPNPGGGYGPALGDTVSRSLDACDSSCTGMRLTENDNSSYVFAPNGALTSVSDATGHQETLGRDGNGHVTTVTDVTSGRSLNVAWAGAHVGSVTSIPQPSSGAVQWTYAYNGDQLITACGPLSGTTCVTYGYTDTNWPQRLTTATARTGKATVSYTYAAPGQPNAGTATASKDGNGNTTTISTAPAPGADPNYLTAPAQVVTVTRPRGGATSYTLDGWARATSVKDPSGATWQYVYNLNGSLSS